MPESNVPMDDLVAATREMMEAVARDIPGAVVPSDEAIRASLQDHMQPEEEPAA